MDSTFLELLRALLSTNDNEERMHVEQEYYQYIESNIAETCNQFITLLKDQNLKSDWLSAVVHFGRCLNLHKELIKQQCGEEFIQNLVNSLLELIQNPAYTPQIKNNMTECLLNLFKISFNPDILEILQQMAMNSDLTIMTSAIDSILGIISIQGIQPEIINSIVTNILNTHAESLSQASLIPLSRLIFTVFSKYKLDICKSFAPASIQVIQDLEPQYFNKSLCVLSNFTSFFSEFFDEKIMDIISIIIHSFQNTNLPRGIRVICFQILVEFGFSNFTIDQFTEVLNIVVQTIAQIPDDVDITSEDYEDETPRSEVEMSLFSFFSGASKIENFNEALYGVIEECLRQDSWQYIRAGLVLINDSPKFLSSAIHENLVTFLIELSSNDNPFVRNQVFKSLRTFMIAQPSIVENYGPQLAEMFRNAIGQLPTEDVLDSYSIFLSKVDVQLTSFETIEVLTQIISIPGIDITNCLFCISQLLPRLRSQQMIDDDQTSEVISFSKQFINSSPSLTVYSLSILISCISLLDNETISQVLDILSNISLTDLNENDYFVFNESIKTVFLEVEDSDTLSHIFTKISASSLIDLKPVVQSLDDDISDFDSFQTFYPRSQNKIILIQSEELDKYLSSLETVLFAVGKCISFPLDISVPIINNAMNYQYIDKVMEIVIEIAQFISPFLISNGHIDTFKSIIEHFDLILLDLYSLSLLSSLIEIFVTGLIHLNIMNEENLSVVHKFIDQACNRVLNSLTDDNENAEKCHFSVGKLMNYCIENSSLSLEFYEQKKDIYFPVNSDHEELISGSIQAMNSLVLKNPSNEIISVLSDYFYSSSLLTILSSVQLLGKLVINGQIPSDVIEEIAKNAQNCLETLDVDDDENDYKTSEIEGWICCIVTGALTMKVEDDDLVECFFMTVGESGVCNSDFCFNLVINLLNEFGFELPVNALTILDAISKIYNYFIENTMTEQHNQLILQLREFLTSDEQFDYVLELIDDQNCWAGVKEGISAIINYGTQEE